MDKASGIWSDVRGEILIKIDQKYSGRNEPGDLKTQPLWWAPKMIHPAVL
jgi:hypothetical protein